MIFGVAQNQAGGLPTAGVGPCCHLPGQAILVQRFFEPQPSDIWAGIIGKVVDLAGQVTRLLLEANVLPDLKFSGASKLRLFFGGAWPRAFGLPFAAFLLGPRALSFHWLIYFFYFFFGGGPLLVFTTGHIFMLSWRLKKVVGRVPFEKFI